MNACSKTRWTVDGRMAIRDGLIAVTATLLLSSIYLYGLRNERWTRERITWLGFVVQYDSVCSLTFLFSSFHY